MRRSKRLTFVTAALISSSSTSSQAFSLLAPQDRLHERRNGPGLFFQPEGEILELAAKGEILRLVFRVGLLQAVDLLVRDTARDGRPEAPTPDGERVREGFAPCPLNYSYCFNSRRPCRCES